MRLKYRGISYEHNPQVVEMSEEKVGGKYRGLDWRLHHFKQTLLIHQPVHLRLTYRGIALS